VQNLVVIGFKRSQARQRQLIMLNEIFWKATFDNYDI
jgi:hypothetical protein